MPNSYVLSRSQWLPQPLDKIFDFFSHPKNLQILTPPWVDFRITDAPEDLQAGSLLKYELRIRKFPVRWTTEISEWQPPHRFVDVQLSGPYKLWRHEHAFATERGGTRLDDTVEYALPFGPLGRMVHWAMVRRDVEGVFDFREKKMMEMFGA